MDRNVGVVTGAGGDIGIAVCEALGKRGLGVLAVDLNEQAASRGAEACVKAGGIAEVFAADVTREKDVYAYVERCQQLWGEAHFFFNNAGIEGDQSPIASYATTAWDQVMAVNLRGVFLGLKAMFPMLRHSDIARVVNTASVAGLIATPMLAAYGASKHAVIGLTKTAAVEFAPHLIAVNALCPGPVESEMMRRIERGISPEEADAARRQYEATVPAHRYAKLAEVANTAAYLLAESPLYLTGQAVAVDGALSVS